jgi:LasA protease
MRLLNRAVLAVWILACLAGSAAAQPTSEFPGTQRPAVTNPAAVYPDGYSSRWLDDADFLYGPRLLDFNLNAFLEQNAPHLVPYSTLINHWCGLYSISPKVLLTVMEMRSSAVSNPAGLANPFAGLAGDGDFDAQLRYTLASLFEDYYAYRRAVPQRVPGDGMNAATYALLTFFRGAATVPAFAAPAIDAPATFATTFGRLFPSTLLRAGADAPDTSIAAIPPSTLLQLPWKNGVSWYFGGVHTTTGNNDGSPMSSLDHSKGGQGWGADTSTDYVVAAHPGTVTVYSSCNVTVTSPSGWSTNYYHLSTLQVSSGQQVSANQTIGVYANNQAQALCDGGSSTGPHVHFSLLNNGEYSPLDGVSISGYVVHSGRFSYDTDPAYMWLTKNGVTYYAHSAPIVSTATVVVPPPNMTINDVSVSEGNAGTKNLTFTVSLSASASSAATATYATEDVSAWSASRTNPAVISIPTSGVASAYPSTISVGSGLGTITKVTAVLRNYSHTWPGDVGVVLVGPGGQKVMLMSNIGSSNDAVNATLTFDDAAAGTMPVGSAPVTGTYRPTIQTPEYTAPPPGPAGPYGTSFSVFNGTNPAGTWSLYVWDVAAPDSGSLALGWSINIATTLQADYVPAVGTVTIGSGSSSQTISVVINGDTTLEPSETFRVNLSNAVNATITDSFGVGTILNDETTSFTDPALTAGTSGVKAVHVTELRASINALRVSRGLSPTAWTDNSLSGVVVKAAHIVEMRTALAQAYAAAGVTAPTYTDTTLTGVVIKAVHISQLRAAVNALEQAA